jgi:hypothetical protein
MRNTIKYLLANLEIAQKGTFDELREDQTIDCVAVALGITKEKLAMEICERRK